MAAKFFKNKSSVFAAVGAATGLGNAFRFPALCISYGAAFILAYALCLAAVCYPLLVAELAFGRKTMRGAAAGIWSKILCAAAANSAFIALYYGVIAAKLEVASLSFAFSGGADSGGNALMFCALLAVLGAAYALLNGGGRALSVSGRLSVGFSLALFSSLAVAGAVRGGAFSSFNTAALKSFAIWRDALGQSLLALSLAAGVMPTYAKSLPEPFSAKKTAFKIVAANFVVCLLTTLSILPFSVTFSRTVGVLCAINAYSQVIFALFSGFWARFVGALLFAVLTVVAVHSLCSLALPALTLAAGRIKRAPLIFCILSACLAPLFSADGMYILAGCDHIACSVNAVIIAVCEGIFFISLRHIRGSKLTF